MEEPSVKTGELVYATGLLALILLAGWCIATAPRRGRNASGPVPRRLADLSADLTKSLGRTGAYLALLSMAVAPILLVSWPLGMLSRHRPLRSLNNDVLHHYDSGLNAHLTSAMKILTQMGNFWQIVVAAVLGAVLLTLLSRTSRWVPAVLILTGLVGSRYLPKIVTNITRVPHPPTDLGTYPSGGVTRLVVIYGILFFVGLRLFAVARPRLRAAVWSLFALMTWTEAYSRVHLQKHWVLDTVGGLLVGGLTLAAILFASRVLPAVEPRSRQALMPGPRQQAPGNEPRPVGIGVS
jgi:membrane-associated phospholipid phosphatase